MRSFVLAIILIAAFLTGALAIELAPAELGPIAIIVNPFGRKTALDAIAEAEGQFLRAGQWPWIAVGAGQPDEAFRRKLEAAGAWLILSPIAVDACRVDLGARY